MEEPFDLPVSYQGNDLYFETRLLLSGYTHKFQVIVNDTEVVYEPDEEGTYRAIVDPERLPKNLDVGLLQAIAQSIAEVLK